MRMMIFSACFVSLNEEDPQVGPSEYVLAYERNGYDSNIHMSSFDV